MRHRDASAVQEDSNESNRPSNRPAASDSLDFALHRHSTKLLTGYRDGIIKRARGRVVTRTISPILLVLVLLIGLSGQASSHNLAQHRTHTETGGDSYCKKRVCTSKAEKCTHNSCSCPKSANNLPSFHTCFVENVWKSGRRKLLPVLSAFLAPLGSQYPVANRETNEADMACQQCKSPRQKKEPRRIRADRTVNIDADAWEVLALTCDVANYGDWAGNGIKSIQVLKASQNKKVLRYSAGAMGLKFRFDLAWTMPAGKSLHPGQKAQVTFRNVRAAHGTSEAMMRTISGVYTIHSTAKGQTSVRFQFGSELSDKVPFFIQNTLARMVVDIATGELKKHAESNEFKVKLASDAEFCLHRWSASDEIGCKAVYTVP
mmetsp:Transcript_43155/g.136453  ORF Transcript_43155/g.136453 Transcript_43155/m.136453 type:complete len:375 (-) Transcript_43155:1038-2162(-)